MKPESDDLAPYLTATEVVTADDPLVRAKAQELTAGASGQAEQARRLFEWVRDRIPHTNDQGWGVVTCTASEVLRAGTGICYAKSHLLAALCRAIEIPAGFCYQRLRDDDTPSGYVLHGFNAIHLPAEQGGAGRWFRLDARGNKPGVDARFSLDEECLAFRADEALGERTSPEIWVDPLPSVVEALRRPGGLREVWNRLPDEVSPP